MKPMISLTLAVLVTLFLILPAAAMQHDHAANTAPQPSSSHEQHDGMAAAGVMVILGDATVDGVRGMAHLKDVQDAMAALGQPATHHLMIAFIDQASGQQLDAGKVAVKVQTPGGQVSEPIALVGMQGHFGADITLDQPGVYHFKIGTELADGMKRTFHFHYQRQ